MSKISILVVDDEPDLLDFLREVLEMNGHTVRGAGSGREAISVCEEELDQIDLLLTDLSLPHGMTGVELAEKLQARKPDLKFLFSSGYDRETVAQKYALPPGAFFLKKPFNPDALAQAVLNCFESDSQRQTKS